MQREGISREMEDFACIFTRSHRRSVLAEKAESVRRCPQAGPQGGLQREASYRWRPIRSRHSLILAVFRPFRVA